MATPKRARGARSNGPMPMPRTGAAPWLATVALVVAGAIYLPGLSNPLIFDDFGSIGRNASIRQLTDLSSIISPPALTPIAGRPVANLSLAINYAIHGLDVGGYHAGNIALHILCALLIYGIARGLLGWPIAFAIALLWLAHPLNSEAVNYLAQRTEVLMAACYLGALYCSLRALDAAHPRRWQAAAVLICAAGMGSKETMVTAPLAIALYDRAFAFASWREALRARGRFYAALASTWILLAAVVLLNGQTTTAGFAGAQTSSAIYFLNQMPVIVRYLRLSVWPDPLVLYYGWAVPLTIGDVWLPMLVVVALTGVVIWTMIRAPRLGYLGAWILLTLGPTSSVVPIATEVAAERRMYLPLIALIALAVMGVVALVRRWKPSLASTSLGFAVTAAIALTFGAVTIARTRDYSSALTMARLDVERWPTPQSHQVYGVALAEAGRTSDAIDHLKYAVDGYPAAGYFLGRELLKAGRLDEAIAALRRFVDAEPTLPVVPSARIAMARALEVRGRHDEAIEELRAVLAASPSRADVHGQLANLLAGAQRFDDAIPHYRAFVDATPSSAEAWTGLGIAQASSGRSADALISFKRAIDLAPQQTQYRLNYARALADLGNRAEARTQIEAVLKLEPESAPARELMKQLRAQR